MIGDAVVNAGLISNALIIVVAITAVSSFVLPSFEMTLTIRMLRFPLMFLPPCLALSAFPLASPLF